MAQLWSLFGGYPPAFTPELWRSCWIFKAHHNNSWRLERGLKLGPVWVSCHTMQTVCLMASHHHHPLKQWFSSETREDLWSSLKNSAPRLWSFTPVPYITYHSICLILEFQIRHLLWLVSLGFLVWMFWWWGSSIHNGCCLPQSQEQRPSNHSQPCQPPNHTERQGFMTKSVTQDYRFHSSFLNRRWVWTVECIIKGWET